MAVKFLDKTGLGYFWSKIKAWCNATFAAIAHTHTSYAVKHSYTTAANAAKNWYRIANANTSQTDTTKPIHAQFILTAYNTSYDAGYYERWFINAEVFGRNAHIVIFGNTQAPFSQARILYENTLADLDANDRPAIDIYLNYVLPNGTTKIEIEEVYNQGWTFLADGQLAASTVPTGFENVACDSLRGNGVGRSVYSDYATYISLQRSDITSNITLADNNTYRSRVLNCTGTRTVTVPSINSTYSWFVIKNFNTTSGVITVHPSTTSVLIDGSNADITLQPGEYIVIHSRAANSYSIIADGRWKSKKADKATTLAGYGITDAKIANGTITLGSNSITPLTSVPSHNQASNTITVMTGYSKPSSGSAIAVSDNLNSAIGKLEAKVDAVDDSNYVHKTGDEDIAGAKSFRSVYLKSEDIVKGTNPSAKAYRGLAFVDSNFDPANAYYMHRLGILEYALGTNGVSNIAISTYKNDANSTDTAGIYVYYDTANDLAYATAPSTLASRSEGKDIVTRDWIGQDNRIVRTSGAQTVAGQKTFVSDLILGNHDARAPSNDTYVCIAGGAGESYDKGAGLFVYGKDFINADNSNAQSGAFLLRSTTGSTHYDLFGNKSGLLTWRGNSVMAGLTTTGSGNAITALSIGTNNVVTATKGSTFLTSHQSLDSCVKTSGNQTVGGEKTFTDHINMRSGTNDANSRYIYIQNDGLTAGIAIDANWWTGFQVIDKNGDFIAGSRFIYYTSKEARVQFDVYQVTTGGVAFAPTSATSGIGTFFPTTSSATLLGMSNKKWKEIWCTQSSINSSSDERLKDYISAIPENILDAWEDINFIQFKFKDAIQEKGNNARFHNGLIAQRIDEVFKNHNIDISKYGLFLYDEWEAEEAVYDDNGKLIDKAVPAGNSYGLRYVEALCMEAAYQRRKNKILENRISELEKQVSDMLQILQNLTSSNG